MALSNINQIRKLSIHQIESEILILKKQIFDLRIRKATSQLIQPHLFKHNKRRLAQLYTVQNEQQ
nr:ribosomal protein L29 [Boldiaceae sp.]